MLSGPQARDIRTALGMSQQELALRARVNKAYISEFETGIREVLPADMLERLEGVLLAAQRGPAGRTSPSIEPHGEHLRLVLRDRGDNAYWPRIASVQWTEEDGSTYSMFLGERG